MKEEPMSPRTARALEGAQRMNKRIKKLWLQALRGNAPQGEYDQGQGKLCGTYGGNDKFCCLGVISDIHAREKGRYWKDNPNSSYISYI